MSPRFAPAATLLPMLVLLTGVSGCPGHLDQIGWAEPDGGFSPSQQKNNNEPTGTGGTGGSAAGTGGSTTGTGGSAGTGGNTTGTGGTGGTGAPTPKADGGARPDGGAPDASAPKPMTMTDASPPPPAPDAGTSAPLPTPVCATATEIADKILTPKCGTCHGKNAPAAGLDLVTTGIKARLLNIPARGCGGKQLVTATDVVGGHFFDKLIGGVANCGGQMPFGAPPLSAQEIKCLKDWIKPTP
jgi:hypothetical protein